MENNKGKYICPRCGIEFKQKCELLQHINKKKECTAINESTKYNKRDLKNLVNEKYKKNLTEGFICPHCMLNLEEVNLNKHIFKTKENLIYHLEHKHNENIKIEDIKKYDTKETEIVRLNAVIINQTELIRKFQKANEEMIIINRKLEDIKKATIYDFIIREGLNTIDLNTHEIEELFLNKIKQINPNKKFICGKINENYEKFNNIETINKIEELNRNSTEINDYLKDKPQTEILKPLKKINKKEMKANFDNDFIEEGFFKNIMVKNGFKIDLSKSPTKLFLECFMKIFELSKYKHIFKMKRGHLMVYNKKNEYEYLIYRVDRYDRDENPEYYTEDNEISCLEELICDFLVLDLYVYMEEMNLLHLFKEKNTSKAWINLYFQGEEPTDENFDIDIYKINTALIYDDLTDYFNNLK